MSEIMASYINRSELEVVIPYGNPTGLLHIRFHNDYKTFCGRECEGWSVSDTPLASVLDSTYCCKRCRSNFFK